MLRYSFNISDGSVKMFYACVRKGENGVFVDYGELKPGEGTPKGVWNIEKGFGTGDYKKILPLRVLGKCCYPMEKVLLAHSKVNVPIKLRDLP